MTNEGPSLESLTHWLAACPAECYQWPIAKTDGLAPTLNVLALACDQLRDLGAVEQRQALRKRVPQLSERHQRLVAITIWLLRDPSLAVRRDAAPAIVAWWLDDLRELAECVRPESMVTDPDRREELVRRCLQIFDWRPAGETPAQAADRLNTLDSIERLRINRETLAAEERARKVREAMARQRAQEAAARYSPE